MSGEVWFMVVAAVASVVGVAWLTHGPRERRGVMGWRLTAACWLTVGVLAVAALGWRGAEWLVGGEGRGG